MPIDDAIDALCAALAAAGVATPRPPADSGSLTALEEAIAPLTLPADVRRLWERVDVTTLAVRAFPQLIPPDSALRMWKMVRDAVWDGRAPLALLTVGYESWNCMSVELDMPDRPGGAMFEWRLEGDTFWRCFNGLDEWLGEITALLGAGAFERRTPEGAPAFLLPTYEDTKLGGRRVAPHPLYGERVEFTAEPLRWPAHWQRATGIDPDQLEPRGATHTIAALLAADPAQVVRATIAGEIYRASSQALWVRDPTGEIVVERPRDTRYIPSEGHRYEFDVVRGAKPRPRAPDGVDAWLEPAGERHTEPTAIRPL